MAHRLPFPMRALLALCLCACGTAEARDAPRLASSTWCRGSAFPVRYVPDQDAYFQYDANDPGKMDRYQAEALVHKRVPAEALAGMICYDEARRTQIQTLVEQAGHATPIVAKREYYF